MRRILMAAAAIFSVGANCGRGQVVNKSEMLANVPFGRANQSTGISFSYIPATVKLAGGRTESGRFVVLTDSAQKLYWWRFVTGAPPAAAAAAADDFAKNCLAVPATGELAVFCTTDRSLMMAISKKTFSDASQVPNLVQEEFNRAAGKYDTGFDYFDKVLNLWPTLGPSFFLQSGHAESLQSMPIVSAKPVGSGWEVLIGGAGGQTAKLTLSGALELQSHTVSPAPKIR
jgi:hypothetical protein